MCLHSEVMLQAKEQLDKVLAHVSKDMDVICQQCKWLCHLHMFEEKWENKGGVEDMTVDEIRVSQPIVHLSV